MAKSGRRSGHGRDLCRAAERGPDRCLLTPVAAAFPLSNCLNGFGTAALTGADLSHAKLRNARFGRANLEGVNFSGAGLNGAVFLRAKNVNSASFGGCDLSEVRFLQIT
jgi:uncharacterized protein YjbI with pentapeptide repeats